VTTTSSCIGKGAVNQDFECFDVGRGGGDVAGVIESVASDGQPDSFFFLLVWFVIANYFAVSDISVFWDVGKFDKKTRVGASSVSNALEKAKPRFHSGCRRGSFISAMYSISFPVIG
jgi:hypothetical protein